ncbi:hypothetical protein D6D21_08467 [Aureobasidium pullulans]|uniref:Vacuolar protein sorting-associated protein 51 homolog n=1 Tax=Aureobasidium pullulans TaxID=5580 RepID=A0AB74IN04_AURPU|nr:hypothetical protein D6D21_08467 [Aureobasidium pullulans]
MSIASPRPSINLSRRTSISTITSTRSPSSSRPASIRDSTNTTANSTPVPAPSRRRDRAALREFYNLQASDAAKAPPAPITQQQQQQQEEDTTPPDALAVLDNPSFSADRYVQELLTSSDAEGLLRTLNSITISSLGLEGDKKALVYDNYTTLLSATKTISKMRENVDPMAPVTTTLEPAVGHIVDVAVGISESQKGGGKGGRKEGDRDVVRWVLGAPERLGKMKEEGRNEEMEKQWDEVRTLLEKWEGVKGVEEVRRKCEEVVGRD